MKEDNRQNAGDKALRSSIFMFAIFGGFKFIGIAMAILAFVLVAGILFFNVEGMLWWMLILLIFYVISKQKVKL